MTHIDQQITQILGQVVECQYCIDGFIPAPVHPVLGYFFQDCPGCATPCPECHGTAVFIVTCCLGHYAKKLNTDHNLIPVICHGCGGLLTTEQIPQWGGPDK